MTPETYRGFEITPIFNYTNGLSDFEIWKIDDEKVTLIPSETIAVVKAYIDDLIEEE